MGGRATLARMFRTPALLALVVTLLAPLGCVYPRRATSLSAVSAPGASTLGAPEHVYRVTIVSAQTGATRRGALSWDDGGGLPDCFVRVYRDDELVFESRTIADSIRPEWNETLPRNLEVVPGTRLRLEVWDADTLSADPVGIWRGEGLPMNAEPGAPARILLEGESWLTVRFDDPRPHRGVGIRSFELRGGSLGVVEVEPHSPAGRAGIVPGDAILAIGSRAVGSIAENEAVTGLSLAADRGEPLRIRSANGSERVVELDRGFTWLVM